MRPQLGVLLILRARLIVRAEIEVILLAHVARVKVNNLLGPLVAVVRRGVWVPLEPVPLPVDAPPLRLSTHSGFVPRQVPLPRLRGILPHADIRRLEPELDVNGPVLHAPQLDPPIHPTPNRLQGPLHDVPQLDVALAHELLTHDVLVPALALDHHAG